MYRNLPTARQLRSPRLSLAMLGAWLMALGIACESPQQAPPTKAPVSAKPATAARPTAAATAQPADDIPTVAGFQTPESVLYDADSDVYLVANINGAPLEKDDNGFISRVTPEAKIETLKWIDGAKDDVTLNAPKGMTISNSVLYVADLTHVRKFDAKTGAPKGEIEIAGATFLNDMATGPDGTVYVSDSGMKQGEKGFDPSGTDAVYQIDAEKSTATALAKGKELGRPNGLYVDDKGVWVVTFGANELYRLGPDGKKTDVHQLPKGSLDGLVGLPDGQLLVSSWAAKTIYRGRASGPFKPLFSGIPAPADIGFDTKRNRVLVPLFNDHKVQLRALD